MTDLKGGELVLPEGTLALMNRDERWDLANQINGEVEQGVKETHLVMHNTAQKAMRGGQVLISLKADCKHGEWLNELAERFRGSQQQAWRYMQVARHQELLANYPHEGNFSIRGALQVIDDEHIKARAKDIRVAATAANKAANELLKADVAPPPKGKYRCIVIDPPWRMEKIQRDLMPNQVGFEYPTMSLEELAAFDLESIADDKCHVWCWTTQKYLRHTFGLLEDWNFDPHETLVWEKPSGFTPFRFMYNAEFVVFGSRGGLKLNKLGIKCVFHAKPREHSRKPDEFYDIARAVSPEPRIDVFSREKRDGFDQWGNEEGKF